MTRNRELAARGQARRLTMLAATVAGVAVAAVALAQENSAQPPPPAQQPTAAPPSNPAFQPGFIDALGHWLKEGADRFQSDMRGAQQKLDAFGTQAQEAAKDATGTMMALPGSRATIGREPCTLAANGAPDCQAAALALCRSRGFRSGTSLDTQSEQKCSARVLLQGPAAGGCKTEIFVTKAMCQ